MHKGDNDVDINRLAQATELDGAHLWGTSRLQGIGGAVYSDQASASHQRGIVQPALAGYQGPRNKQRDEENS